MFDHNCWWFVPWKGVRYREVSAIKHIRYREVPLYCASRYASLWLSLFYIWTPIPSCDIFLPFKGQRWGVSRKQCDAELVRNERILCEQKYRGKWKFIKRTACLVSSYLNFGAVKTLGGKYYRKISPPWCSDTCVRNFGRSSIKNWNCYLITATMELLPCYY